MTKAEMTEILLAAKKAKKLTWEALAASSGMSEMFVASCCYGENSMTEETADKLCAALDVDRSVRDALLEFPTKGNSLGAHTIPTDPLP